MTITRVQGLQPGERTNLEEKPVRNKPLLAAPEGEFRLIRPHLQFVNLPSHLTLHQPHRTVKFAHFPNEGLISLVVEMKDGKSVEAGLFGNDGAAGMPAVMGLSRSPLREVVQITGNGFRVKISTMREILQSSPQIHVILGRYA